MRPEALGGYCQMFNFTINMLEDIAEIFFDL